MQKTPALIILAVLPVLGILLTGCVTSTPPDSTDFALITSLRELEGLYCNLGEGEEGMRPVYLSSLIWPSNTGFDHSSIDTIRITAVSEKSLRIEAATAEQAVKTARFIAGKDFSLRDGRLRLQGRLGWAGFKIGEPIFGPYYESTEIGLSSAGEGKYSHHVAVAGLVYMVIPMAMGVREDVRFVRIFPAENP